LISYRTTWLLITPWVDEHPDYFVGGSDDEIGREPQNYFRLKTKKGSRVFAYGRDPFFSGWPDTYTARLRQRRAATAMIGGTLAHRRPV
jgi:hypothetical protein